MQRNDYTKYFHQDFFESSGSDAASSNHTSIDIPAIAKVAKHKDTEKSKPIKSSYKDVDKTPKQEQSSTLLFNKAPNIFETSYHIQKMFWAALIILALFPVMKSGFVTLISLTNNIAKTVELKEIKNQLIKDKKNVQSKFDSYHSDSGMKRTIKEEIKVIEKNEILIKIVK